MSVKSKSQKEQRSYEVSSWSEWFEMCGPLSEKMEAYESCLRKYHGIREDADGAYKSFAARHSRRFWEKDGPITGHMLKPCFIAGGVGALLGLVGSVMLAVMRGRGIVRGLAGCAPLVALGFVVLLALGIVVQILRVRSVTSQMAAMEDELASGLRYIPAKYRNAFCVDALYHLHADYGVNFYDQALESVDNHIRNNSAVYVPVHILSDVPFSDKAVLDAVASGEDEEAGPDPASIPYLPEDIQSHTHEGAGDAEAELAALIGMEDIKKQVRQLRRRLDFYGTKNAGDSGNNIVMMGPPGTGKSVTARIIAKMFYDFGIIRRNQIVEIDGEYLKSGYVGQTGGRTSAIIQWAKGGMLFIDEAYTLFNERDNSSTGAEAIGVLLKAMEDMRDDLVVCLAGYEDPMNRLLASNEGFASRLRYRLYFEAYDSEELTQIFELFLQKSGTGVTEIEPAAREKVRREFDMMRRSSSFGNARDARNACSELLDLHADRYVEGYTAASDRDVITEGDVDAWLEVRKTKMAQDGRNVLASSKIDESIISTAELMSRTKDGAADWTRTMDSLIGLDRVKEEMLAFKHQADFYKDDALGQEEKPQLNVSFVGPPGVGKTSMAQVFCGMLYEAGYLRVNRFLDINGSWLVANYVGQTKTRTQAVIDYVSSAGIMLFIDEAYLLSTNSGGSGANFGAEAIGVLVDQMEKDPDLVIVFAGYSREMSEFFSVNSGLASRVAKTMHFEPYSVKELMLIFNRMAATKRFKVDKPAWGPIKANFEANMRDPLFGNGRHARQLLQSAIGRHATRWANGEVVPAHRMVIEAQDIDQG